MNGYKIIISKHPCAAGFVIETTGLNQNRTTTRVYYEDAKREAKHWACKYGLWIHDGITKTIY